MTFLECLSVQEVRPNCWQVLLKFGPHCFTLAEYVGTNAEGAAKRAWRVFRNNYISAGGL